MIYRHLQGVRPDQRRIATSWPCWVPSTCDPRVASHPLGAGGVEDSAVREDVNYVPGAL